MILSDPFKAIQDVRLRSKVFSTASRLSRGSQYLPRSYWIDPSTIMLPEKPLTSGRRAEVYMGTHDGDAVAVKVLRTPNQESAARIKKVSMGEENTWRPVDSTTNSGFSGR